MTRRGDFKQKSFLLFLYATICVTPDVEIIETELEGQILTGSNGSNADNVGSEEPEWDD